MATARWHWLLWGAVSIALAVPTLGFGHRLAPALLTIEDSDEPGVYSMRWQEAAVSSAPMVARWPEHCEAERGDTRQILTPTGPASESRWMLRCEPHSLAGGEFRVDGLLAGTGFVLLRFAFNDSAPVSYMLSHADPVFTVPTHWRGNVPFGYLKLGTEHILSGYDHLLFVFGLLLLCRSARELLFTITAFTLGHSITLGLAAFDVVLMPLQLIEYLVILSILYMAVAVARRARLASTSQWRAPLLAVLFGLLHGQGFASFLRGIGLPPGKAPSALLGFNIGIELGQLLFVGTVLLFALLLVRVPQLSMPQLRLLCTELMGALAALWTVQATLELML